MPSSSRARRTFSIAVVLVAGVAVALPLWLGVPRLSLVGGAVAALMLVLVRANSDGTVVARTGAHLALLAALGLVSYACYGVGIPTVITVYFSTLIVLGASHMLGTRAALAWSLPCLLLIAGAAIFPPEKVYPVDVASTAFTRMATLLTVLAFSVSFRRHQDRQALELAQLALTDALTGLANRRQMERALEDAIERADRFDRRCGVVFVDVDGLKRVNDQLGHEAGDQLISQVARRIEMGSRRTDTVARLGGDEFVVVLSEVSDEPGVERFARALLERVCQPLALAESRLTASVSLGAAVYPNAAGSSKELLRLADAAMYAAKQAGGACLCMHDGEGIRDVG